jgi:hypothetical protein
MEKSPRVLMPDYVNRPAIAENQARLAKPEKIAGIARLTMRWTRNDEMTEA